MVMEAATLNSPQRKYNVIPVQKSLSLPSYARAGGEGIDHRLIFAALEQKEKVRRKSRIFTREKSARHNIFCLPIPTSAKCKETSLSSDTSCSSLEYQKPKPASKDKKDVTKCSLVNSTSQNDQSFNETAISKTSISETKTNTDPIRRDDLAQNVNTRDSELNSSLRVNEHRKGHRSPVDTLKVNVGSSDSVDRSSRSSNDSLSRKERLVAIKARVEAAREKYGDSSSEEDSCSAITRYNSDGVIHRTVRDVKSKSYRLERKLRRRSQDEWAVKKANRQSNLSLPSNSENGDINLSLGKSTRTEEDINHLEIKTDFCPSPNFPDLMKKSYFSDFPSKENVERFVKTRIRYIEDEERKRRSGSDFREKIGVPSRQSPQNVECVNSASRENRRQIDLQNGLHINTSEKLALTDLAARVSPIPRSSQAPTPPPRSPKSINLVNKAFIQHQNASLLHHDDSLERKYFRSNIQVTPHTKSFDKFNSKSDAVMDSKYTDEPYNMSSEKQKIRELITSRRKTCGNFDFIEKNIFHESCPNSISAMNNMYASANPLKKDNKGYFSSSEAPCIPPEGDAKNKIWKSKWQENEQRREYMFNSLESKRKHNVPSWLKWRNPPLRNETCLCHLFPNNNLTCVCKADANVKEMHTNSNLFSFRLENNNSLSVKNTSSFAAQYSSDRLSKSEVNIAFNEAVKTSPPDVKKDTIINSLCQITRDTLVEKKDNYGLTDKISATANLESAMEELESVYRSLKISSDNLSDKNSVSNTLSGDEKPKPKCGYDSIQGLKRRSSVCDTNWNSSIIKSNLEDISKLDGIKYPKYMKSQSFNSTPNDPIHISNENSSDANQFSIDELFNDLTKQLDLEQKLLKEPRDNRSQQAKVCCQANSFSNPRRPNHPPSQISIRKEFYDNLCKRNLNQSKSCNPIADGNSLASGQSVLTKEKYKAVRSLSENISFLMSTASSDPTLPENTAPKREYTEDKNAHLISIEQSSPKYYENIRDPTKLGAKDLPCKVPNLLSRTEQGRKAQNARQEEIRHIRVSMDTSDFKSEPVVKTSFSVNKQYPSLSSAVCSSQLSPKSEVPKHGFKEMSSTNCNSKDSINILDEAGVEKLLNSLLGEVPESQHHYVQEEPPTNCNSKESTDVIEKTGLENILSRLLNESPERQQSSLLLSKDISSSTPPTVASGEMRVMQHLDVIRLKPVPT